MLLHKTLNNHVVHPAGVMMLLIVFLAAPYGAAALGAEARRDGSRSEADKEVPSAQGIRFLDEVLDVSLVGTRPRRGWEFSVMPRIDDAFTRDYIRIPIRLRRGMTDNFELMAGITPYLNNDKSNENRNGWQDWRIGGKYRFKELFTSYVDTAVGLSIVLPIGGKDDTTDGYNHYKPYFVVSKTCDWGPNAWLFFTNVEFDFLSGDPELDENDTRDPKDHALSLTPGVVFAPPSYWRLSFYMEYQTTKISDDKRDNIWLVPGMFLDLPKNHWRWLPGKWRFEFGVKVGAADREDEWGAVGKVKFDFGSLFGK